ncbi:MAG: hypothetical protein WC683_09460 [bacterium]|jgi:hypothetical protein
MPTSDRTELQVVRVKDTDTQRALEDARERNKAAQAQGFAGVDVTVTFTAAAAQTFSHKLGRQPIGWFVLDATGGAPLLHRTAWDTRTLTLYYAGGFTVVAKIRVF